MFYRFFIWGSLAIATPVLAIGPLEFQLIRMPQGQGLRAAAVPLMPSIVGRCSKQLEQFAVDFALAGRRVVQQLIPRAQNSSGSALIGPSGKVIPGLFYPAFQSKDGQWFPLEAGMRQVFLKEILRAELAQVERHGASLATEWAKIARQNIISLKTSASSEVDADGLGTDPFLQSQKQWLIEKGHLAGLVTQPAPSQFKRVKDLYVQKMGKELKDAGERLRQSLRSVGEQKISDSHNRFVKNPVLGAYDEGYYQWLFAHYAAFVEGLRAIYPVAVEGQSSEFGQLCRLDYEALGSPFAIEDGWPVLRIPAQKLIVYYDEYLGGMVAHHANGLAVAQGPIATLSHGAGAMSSNVAGWGSLTTKFTGLGINPIAADLPGSMGPFGTALNDIEDPMEIAALLGLWQRSVGLAHVPPIAGGRSLGSTQQFANAAFHYLHGGDNSFPNTSTFFLTAFANPNTIDDQIETVREQASGQGREAVAGLTPGGLDRARRFCINLNEKLDEVCGLDPNALAHFGDFVFFVQGEADSDGAPRQGSGTVVTELEKYRDQYAPFAHIYVVPDPFKNNPELAALLDADLREASHFLFSSRPNVTAKNVPHELKEVPPHLWPQFSDQTTEMVALMFATQDYIADFSPLKDIRTQMLRIMLKEDRRANYTDMKWGYFYWFVVGINEQLRKVGHEIDIERLFTDEVQPGSASLEQRLKRVIVFIQDEAKRASALLEKSPQKAD